MKRVLGAALLAAACGGVWAADDQPAPKKDEPAKKAGNKAGAGDEPAKGEKGFNEPPKNQALVPLGVRKGKVTGSCDGKSFRMQVEGVKDEVEVNLGPMTRIQVPAAAEFDDKGNPKRGRRGPVKGTPEDIKEGAPVLVELSGTRGGWYRARSVLVLGD
jgi:hypothetical protein